MPSILARTAALCAFASLAISTAAAQQAQTLLATPSTVAWGFYSAQAKPALTVKSGDTVKIRTLSTCGPRQRLEALGIAPADIPTYVDDIYKNYPAAEKGPGGHILTGPIFVESAEPGDVLEVRIQSIKMNLPYAYNTFGQRPASSPKTFRTAKPKSSPSTAKECSAHFSDNPPIDIPLHPFFGSMGVAPPPEMGRISSAPPGIHAGNLDNKELVAGTTLFIPIHAKGALFEVGDGHAAQGDGEVDITALETSLTGTFQFIVRKDLHLTWPRPKLPPTTSPWASISTSKPPRRWRSQHDHLPLRAEPRPPASPATTPTR